MPIQRTIVTSDQIAMEDFRMSADDLEDKYNPKGGGEHPIFTKAHWRNDVAHQITVYGYWEWVRTSVKDTAHEAVELVMVH